jgi:hypothetical protein
MRKHLLRTIENKLKNTEMSEETKGVLIELKVIYENYNPYLTNDLLLIK